MIDRLLNNIKDKRKFTLYALKTKEFPNSFLTLALNKNQVKEYFFKLLQAKFFEHYIAWCKIKNLDSSSEQSWLEYYSTCIPDSEKDKYEISKYIYPFSSIASIIRMFVGCVPIGCSFNNKSEYEYFVNSMSDEDKEKFNEEINKLR